ncbi:MAG TPA: N-acetylmuramic acid 6-phosphate etherase [Acidimicrobiales bacterium]|nr:N-acetylmuramic acid 6-phosphate etherase [Acidimicrobiales bacterium]
MTLEESADGGTGGPLRVSSPTEERNPRTLDIDAVPVLALLELINDEDATVPGVVRRVLPDLATLVEITAERLRAGGRVHYFGAGTSGRLGLLDAAEIPPTYGLASGVFVAHLAGGDDAFRVAREGSEDDDAQGEAEARAAVAPGDVVIGLASSGYTPYVRGGLRGGRAVGAHTALVTSNPGAPLAAEADTFICVDTGPEVITGSTRMKSGTAQKLVLNAFSTAVMVRTGRTWSNLMVAMVPSNRKLQGRVLRMLGQATGQDEARCEAALSAAGGETKTALVMLRAGVGAGAAREALTASDQVVAAALDRLRGREGAPAG